MRSQTLELREVLVESATEQRLVSWLSIFCEALAGAPNLELIPRSRKPPSWPRTGGNSALGVLRKCVENGVDEIVEGWKPTEMLSFSIWATDGRAGSKPQAEEIVRLLNKRVASNSTSSGKATSSSSSTGGDEPDCGYTFDQIRGVAAFLRRATMNKTISDDSSKPPSAIDLVVGWLRQGKSAEDFRKAVVAYEEQKNLEDPMDYRI